MARATSAIALMLILSVAISTTGTVFAHPRFDLRAGMAGSSVPKWDEALGYTGPAGNDSDEVVDLYNASTHVLIGEVERIESRFNENRTLILTYVTIHVDSLEKGSLDNSTIVVVYIGGEAEGVGLRLSDQPSFMLEERVKLYLQAESEPGIFRVTYGNRGKITLEGPICHGSLFLD